VSGGQRLPRVQAQFAGRTIHRLDHPALRGAAQQRQWLLGFGALAQRGIQGQLREHNAHPAHANLSARP